LNSPTRQPLAEVALDLAVAEGLLSVDEPVAQAVQLGFDLE
jgi:hypothetical protein